jgi:hypothetical protein
MAPDLVVAIGDQQKDPLVAQAAAQKPEEIECRLICPMNVLEDDQRGSGGGTELIEHRVEESRTPGIGPK